MHTHAHDNVVPLYRCCVAEALADQACDPRSYYQRCALALLGVPFARAVEGRVQMPGVCPQALYRPLPCPREGPFDPGKPCEGPDSVCHLIPEGTSMPSNHASQGHRLEGVPDIPHATIRQPTDQSQRASPPQGSRTS
jgi:hypothetical protein